MPGAGDEAARAAVAMSARRSASGRHGPAAMRRVRPAPAGAMRGPVLTYSGDPFQRGIARDTALRTGRDRRHGGRPHHPGRAGAGGASAAARRGAGHGLRARRAHHGRFHRLPCPLPADADYRRGRRTAARLAQPVHLRRRAALCRRQARARRGQGLPAGKPTQRRHDLRGALHGASAVGRCAVCGSREARPAHDRRQGPHGPQRAGQSTRYRPQPATTSPRR